jgi:hypothetical protein
MYLRNRHICSFNLEKNKMKANKTQQCICDIVCTQQNYWKHSNDLSSPTHLVDIEEECRQLSDSLDDTEIEELTNKLQDLYRFIRKFDNNG